MIVEMSLLAGAGYWAIHSRKKSNMRLAERKHHHQHRHKSSSSIDLRSFLREIKATLLSSERHRLQIELDPELSQAQEQARLRAKKQMHLSFGALSLTLLAIPYSLFTLPATIAVLYLSRYSYALIWKDFKRGHYLSFYLVGAMMNLAMIATGHLFLAALSAVVFSFFARIINRLEDSAQGCLLNVFGDHPERVWIILKDETEVEIDFHAIKVGNQVIVCAGEVIPIDGLVVTGLGQVDQHILTGESQPVDKVRGDSVFAATLLLSGRITVEVTTAGDQTVAAKINQVLNHTQSYKDTVIIRGRKISDRFIPLKIGLATLTLPLLGANAAMAVMWANLGDGLSTSGPMAVLTYLQLLARHNILIKDGRVFESLRQVDTIVFDKTGTLTEEQPTLGRIHGLNSFSQREVLTLAAIAEARQTHPIARAIIAHAEAEQLQRPLPEEASYEVGYGIKVRIDGQWVRVGSARFLQHEGILFPPEVNTIQQQAEANSYSLVYVGVDRQLAGILEMEPTIRPEAREIVQMLKWRGLELCIISGDHNVPTRRMAEQLGIDRYFAETLPEHKAELVQQLRDEGRFVCFVGDGINDAIALKAAQISISLKGASTAATDTAQIVLMDGTLQRLPQLFTLVDEFECTMRRAVMIGFIPGVFTITGVFFWHFGVAIALFILYANIAIATANFLWPLFKYHRTLLEADLELPANNDESDKDEEPT